jgi:hypothetical protein
MNMVTTFQPPFRWLSLSEQLVMNAEFSPTTPSLGNTDDTVHNSQMMTREDSLVRWDRHNPDSLEATGPFPRTQATLNKPAEKTRNTAGQLGG